MSKAEERCKEIMQAALNYANNLDDVKPIDGFSRNLCIALGQAFIKGVEWADSHKPKKDLELSWEDIKAIDELILYVNRKYSFDDNELYQEVLKRFKDLKERKKDGE